MILVKVRYLIVIFSVVFSFVSNGQTAISGVINSYAKVLDIDSCVARLTVDDATGFKAGDTVLLIQMKGATVDLTNTALFGTITSYNSAGNYEIAKVAGISGNALTLTYRPVRSYDVSGSIQVVRMPFYDGNVTVSAGLTAASWDGNKGGILAFHATGTVALNGNVDVSGRGFRGGLTSVNGYVSGRYLNYFCPMSVSAAQKGEGIFQPDTQNEAGRGKAANGGGGGNDHNAGGGGGGNFGTGGIGGNEWNGWGTPNTNGGVGGVQLNYTNADGKIFLGGGGGGGHQNNGNGMDGTSGGGIIMIRAAAITGNSNYIRSNGSDNGVTRAPGDDAGGGGGAGGSVLLDVAAYNGNLTVEVKGGKGGSVSWAGGSQAIGPGGGGGGGVLWSSQSSLPGNVTVVHSGGLAGVLTHSGSSFYNTSWGAAAGQAGGVVTGLSLPESNRPFIFPDVDLGGDIEICNSQVVLQSSGSYTAPSYLWSTGATTPDITVVLSGAYWLEVADNGCTARDTVQVDLTADLIIDLGENRALCDYQFPFVLACPQAPGTTYLWSTGFTGSQIIITDPGVYWVQVERNTCKGGDTIEVRRVNTPSVFLGSDKVICEDAPEEIGMDVPGASYLWNTGSTLSHILVTESGTYWLQADREGCVDADTIYIDVIPSPLVNLGPDGFICDGQEILLDAGNPGYTYYWNTGAASRTISVGTAGTYWAAVASPEGCIGTDSVLYVFTPDPLVRLGADTSVCEETPLLLVSRHENAESLTWSTGATSSSISVTTGGMYVLSASNACATVSDTIHISQLFCDIWVPNAFSPNGDGVNDVFRVLGNIGRLSKFGLSVYNRWGQRIFHTMDRYAGWDGRHEGGEALLGTYIYVLSYELAGKPVLQKGSFHLLR